MPRLALAALVLLAGCSDYNLVDWDIIDSFNQQPADKVDILMVVDNSCSMEPYQEQLASNFDAFISFFIGANVDYQIGVTTTTIEKPAPMTSATPPRFLEAAHDLPADAMMSQSRIGCLPP